MLQAIDAYCERLGPEYWAEPVNAVSNLAFLLAAFVMWRRVRGQGMPLAMALVVNLAVIGVGSWLFHTHAQRWSAIADVLPIGVFILLYLYAANRVYWRLPLWGAVAATAAFVPYAAVMVPVFARVPELGSSAGYAPVPLLIGIYALALWRRLPQVAQGLAVGAWVLVVSLAFRTLDAPLCAAFPQGMHFLWHLMNALMLGWMIEVLRRHLLALRDIPRDAGPKGATP